jgi:hypothetical protein
MFELLGGGVLGSLFGGLFRLAPEVLKFLDKGNERKHELSMFTLQTDLEKMRGQFKMEERYVDYSVTQLETIKEAFKEQSKTAKEAGWFVSAVSALVRPGITWALFFMYAAVKIAAITLAMQTGGHWAEILRQSWDVDDFAMLNMCLTFWFVGRSIEKYNKQ